MKIIFFLILINIINNNPSYNFFKKKLLNSTLLIFPVSYYNLFHSDKAKRGVVEHENGHFKLLDHYKDHFTLKDNSIKIERKWWGIYGHTNYDIKKNNKNLKALFEAKLAGGINQLIHAGKTKDEIINLLTKERSINTFLTKNYYFGDEIESLKNQEEFAPMFEKNSYKNTISNVYDLLKK